jgi:hypothetical protein
MDPTGESFTFERGASKAMGGSGWAEVWYRGHFAWMVAAGVRNPARFDRDATELLTAMNTGGSAFVLCAVVYAVSI